MKLPYALISTIALALVVKALPSGFDTEQEVLVEADHALPEAGQIVFEPTHFGVDDSSTIDPESDSIDTAIFEDWKVEVVKQHNAYRSKYGAPAVSWSDSLYPAAQQWANQCKFEHSNGQGKYGENLASYFFAAGTGGSYGFSSGLKSWMDESSKYDYNKPGFSKGTGHFTQVVWKSSKQVACAIGSCRAGTIFQQPSQYVVCRYSPPGNFQGRYAENVGRPRK